MSINRQVFNIATQQPAAGDTGLPWSGELRQVRWYPQIAGATHQLEISQLAQLGDTGQYGYRFLNMTNALGAQFVRSPRQAACGPTGLEDTGHFAPVVSDNGYLRVKVSDTGGAPVAGRLEVWTAD